MSELEALLLSAAVEAPIAFALVRAMRWPGRGAWRAAGAAALATAVTHPQLWAGVLWLTPRLGWTAATAALEGVVVVVEAGLIAWMADLRLRHAALVSLAANGASLGVGLLIGG